MATVEVKNLAGKTVGKVDLDDEVFAAEINEHLLWEVVKMQRARSRAGTHSTKTRAYVRGGGKKPYKQKGTGNARQGSIRPPNYVGGGKVFAPHPRDYSYSMPKKAIAGALRSALSLRSKESKIVVVESFVLDAIKTKSVNTALDKLGAGTALIVEEKNENLAKSTRNLGRAKYLRPEGLNVYDVLNFENLVISKASLEAVTAKLRAEGNRGSSGEAVPSRTRAKEKEGVA